jgi:hypothetical protein
VGRPVKLVLDRSQMYSSTGHRLQTPSGCASVPSPMAGSSR